MKNSLIILFLIIGTTSCSSLLKYKKESTFFKNAEFENKVTIVETEEKNEIEPVATVSATVVAPPVVLDKTLAQSAPKATAKPVPKPKRAQTKSAAIEPIISRRQPDIESDEGFGVSRRPAVDPFLVGETVVHDVSYLGASAGTLTLKVNPFAVVNGRKSYNFFIDLKSNSFFSNIYAVDDQVQTYVDYEELVPHVFKLNIRDSGQVKEAQSYFDNQTLKADYWERRYTEKSGHEEKKQSWSILPYSQNPFSAIFYMRIFKFSDSKEYAFRVADDEKNVVFKAQVVGRSKLKTSAGTFNAIKLKAEIHSRGNLAKAKDFYLWLSDDERKYILRIEVKLPIGSLVSEASSIKAGRP